MPITANVLCWRDAPIMHRLSIRGFAILYGLVHLLCSACLQGVFTAPCTRICAGTFYGCATIYFVAAAGNIPPFMFPSDASASAFSCGASFPACSCFASTVVVPCIRPGSVVRGLGCGVDAANLLPGRAPLAWPGSSRP